MSVKKVTVSYDMLAEMLTESVKRHLFEKRGIQSKRLYNLMKEKGKPSYYEADLNAVTDDEIVDKVDYRDIKGKPNPYAVIRFDDNTCLLVKKSKENQSYLDKFEDRFKERNRTDGNDAYRWHNKDAEDLAFKNPYFKDWDKKHQRKAMDNIRNKRDFYDGWED